jgi:hypothetical protein
MKMSRKFLNKNLSVLIDKESTETNQIRNEITLSLQIKHERARDLFILLPLWFQFVFEASPCSCKVQLRT